MNELIFSTCAARGQGTPFEKTQRRARYVGVFFASFSLTLLSATVGADNNPPRGSYQDTCQNVRFDSDALQANCKQFNGAYGPATMLPYVSSCVGDIQNYGGNLVCSRAAPRGGSYQNSCSDIVMTANRIISARCKDQNGNLVSTGINAQGCVGDISNYDGHLSCNSGSVTPPSGSYLRTCWNVHATKVDVSATCRTSTGNDKGRTVLLNYPTTCDPKDPNKDISNHEGALVCAENVGYNPNGGNGGCPDHSCRCMYCPPPPTVFPYGTPPPRIFHAE